MNNKQSAKNILIRIGHSYFRNCNIKGLPQNPKKILIFTRKAIGDIIMAIPAFRAIRNRYPQSHITFWTMEWNREIAEMLDFWDEIRYEKNSVVMHQNIWGLVGFILKMRKQKFDMAILLDSFMFPFYCYLAGIPVRIGYQINHEGFALTHVVQISEADYRLDNFLKIAKLVGADVSDRNINFSDDRDNNKNTLKNDILPENYNKQFSFVVGIVCGGGRNPGQMISAKNWSSEGFVKVIINLINRWNALILLFGKGDEDLKIAERVIMSIRENQKSSGLNKIINLVNKTSLAEASALLKICDVLITNDTALMHLAAMVGTPTLSIFGPTDPKNLAPRGLQHRFIKSSLSCSPCYENKGYLECNSECMREIQWERVYAEVSDMLNNANKKELVDEHSCKR